MPYQADVATEEQRIAQRDARLREFATFLTAAAGIVWAIKVILGQR